MLDRAELDPEADVAVGSDKHQSAASGIAAIVQCTAVIMQDEKLRSSGRVRCFAVRCAVSRTRRPPGHENACVGSHAGARRSSRFREPAANRIQEMGLFRRSNPVITEADLEAERFYAATYSVDGPDTVAPRLAELRDELGVRYVNLLSAFSDICPASCCGYRWRIALA